MSKDKYGDINTLLDENKVEIQPRIRAKRPSPALSAITGDSKPTKLLDSLKADKNAAVDALNLAREQFQKEKEELLTEIGKEQTSTDSPVILIMPVTKQKVTFKLKRVDTNLIDVSPENERIQTFLDEISLNDILPSIRKQGQQKPGTLRPTGDGRFELIEGSRRLAAIKLVGQKYLALVGDIPDADVRDLSIIENKQKGVSSFEKAKAYQRQIDNGEYRSWTQLGAAKSISSTHIARYKLCAQLDDSFVHILESPSDMPLSYGETIAKLLTKSKTELMVEVKELLNLRNNEYSDDATKLEVNEIIKRLKSAVRVEKKEMPVTRKPLKYSSINSEVKMKHSVTSKGGTKLEFLGVTSEQVDKIVSFLSSTFQLKKD